MTQNISIIQLAQLGLAEKTAQEIQSHPEVLRQAAQQQTPEILLRQNEIIQGTEESDKALQARIRERREKRRQGREKGQSKRREAKQTNPGKERSTDAPPTVGLWAGKIVNVKV